MERKDVKYTYTILPYWIKPQTLQNALNVDYDLFPLGDLPTIPESTDGVMMEHPPIPQTLKLVPIRDKD